MFDCVECSFSWVCTLSALFGSQHPVWCMSLLKFLSDRFFFDASASPFQMLSLCVDFCFTGGPTLSFDRLGNEPHLAQNAPQPDAKLPSNMFASDEKPQENEWSRSELLACILISVACGHGCGGCRRNRQKKLDPAQQPITDGAAPAPRARFRGI